MVEIRTPTLAPGARPAERISTGQASGLYQAGASMQKVADQFSQYHEEKAADAADLIWAKAQADWGRRFNEGARTATDGFTGSTLQEYDAYVDEVLPTVPERQVENMQHMFAKYRIGLEAKALEVEAAKRAEARAKARAEAQRLRELALLEEPSFANYQAISDGLKDENRRQLLGVYANAVLNGDDDMAVADFRGLLEDTDTFDQLLTADQKLDLMNGIDKYEAASAREDEALIQVMIEDATAVAANTGKRQTNDILDAIEFSAMTDADKATYRQKVADSVLFAQDTFDIRQQPPVESAAYLEDLRKEASTADDFKRVGIYADALSKHQDALRKDQAGYVQATGFATEDFFKEAMSAEDPAAKQEAFGAYVARMDDQYLRLGIPEGQRTYLPVGYAENMASEMNTQENGLTGVQLDQFVQSWGDNADQITQELIANGLNDFVSAQLWRPYDPLLNEMLAFAKGADMGDVKTSYEAKGEKRADLESNFHSAVEEYSRAFTAGRGPDAQRFMSSMAQVAIDTYMVHKNNGGTMSEDEFLGRMFKEQVLVDPVVTMIVPEGMDPRKITAQTYALLADADDRLVPLMDQEMVSRIAAQENVEVDTEVMAAVIRSNGTFVLNDAGDGVRLAYNMNGMTVMLTPEFTFSELNRMGVGELSFETVTQEPIGGTVVVPSVTGEPMSVAEPGTVVIQQPVEKEYDSSERHLQEDIDSGFIRPGESVIVDGEIVVPIP